MKELGIRNYEFGIVEKGKLNMKKGMMVFALCGLYAVTRFAKIS
jgi:hypothetical protein